MESAVVSRRIEHMALAPLCDLEASERVFEKVSKAFNDAKVMDVYYLRMYMYFCPLKIDSRVRYLYDMRLYRVLSKGGTCWTWEIF